MSWDRVFELFEKALEQPQDARAAWLDGACAGQETLRREVESLLAGHQRAEGILERPVQPLAQAALDEAQQAAAPQECAGPYRILAEIGRGGMGVVYKAEDPRLGRKVALKFLPQYLTGSEEARQRLLAEARAASALDHPNICTIYDIGETPDGRLFFAMAYYEGRTLAERLEEGPPAAEEALAVAVQVAGALEHAHAAGVVHRDIKPSNLFLTARGEAKILDFGLARVGTATLTDPGTRLGTLAYMSPEQAQGKPVDHRTDVWSLGVVLYEMASGRRPFEGEDPAALLYAIAHRDPPPVTGPLAPLVQRALRKDPGQRYQQVSELRRDLLALRERRAPAVPAVRTRSVGREKELSMLRDSFQACAAGSGRVLCVTGEPGMGKTTLVEDFLAELAAAGTPCLIARGRCSERLAGAEAYLPLLEALESLMAREPRGPVGRLMKEKAPTWYVQVAPAAVASDPSFAGVMLEARVASQERLKWELNVLLHELSSRVPVVIFCDDLHWADVSTVDMLSYLLSRSDSMRLLAVTAYRPSDLHLANHPFLQVRRELQSRGLCSEIALEFLSERDIARLLEGEFPDHRFPSFLAGVIRGRTEGNPLFVTELLRELRDGGVIAQKEGHWVLAREVPAIQRDLPESIRGILERKIARLEDRDRKLLEAASVQGQLFDSATVARVLGIDVGEVEERLEGLARLHRFVQMAGEKELPDGSLTQRCGFLHILYQNVFYAGLRTRRKAELSVAIAEALLESYGASSGPQAADIACLFEAGREFERAAHYYQQAAEYAASVHANEEAVKLATRALANARQISAERRLPRLLASTYLLGRLHLTLSRLQEAVADFELAEKTAEQMGDVEARVNSICAAALAVFNLKKMDLAREYASRALRLAQEAGSETGAASAELVLGLERMCYGATGEAEASFACSVPVLQRRGPPLHALEAIGFSGLLHSWKLDYDSANRTVNWTLQRARELGAPYHVVMNLFVRGMTLFNQGRLSKGLDDLWEGMRLAEVNKERFWLSRYPNTLGWVYRELQDLETALRYDLEGARVARENGYGKPEANSRVNLAHDYMELGEPHRALEHLERAGQIFEEDVWFRWRYNIRLKAELARYWLIRGDAKQAGRCAAESLELARPRHARKHLAWAHKLLGDVAAAEERFADARREYEAALAVLARHRCPIIEWKILLAAAEMASAYRDVALAEQYRGRCQAVLRELADSLLDERLRGMFLGSEAVRRALA
jgi:tetratricopeptide (TPR) repeat protein